MNLMKRTDALFMFVIPVAATILSLAFRANLLLSIALFLLVPCLYLLGRNPGIARKSILFSLIMSVPMWIFIDGLAAINGAWVVPESVFPFKLFGLATVEVYLYGLLWILYAVLFYEHFFDKGKRKDAMSKRFLPLFYLCMGMIILPLLLFVINPEVLLIPFFYLVIGTVFVILPLALFLVFYSQFVGRFALVGLYFFFVFFVFEIVALRLEQWFFPGQFIGSVSLLGVEFPIEELLIWMMCATPALLVYYEFFADDRRLRARW